MTSEYGRPDGYLLAGIAKEWKGRFEREQLPEVLNDTFGVTNYSVRGPGELGRLLESWKEEESGPSS